MYKLFNFQNIFADSLTRIMFVTPKVAHINIIFPHSFHLTIFQTYEFIVILASLHSNLFEEKFADMTTPSYIVNAYIVDF